MGIPSSNQFFTAAHTGPGTPASPTQFTAAEIVAGSLDSGAVSTATSAAVSTVNAAAPDSTSISQARSQAVSAASVGSVADSKAISDSTNISVVESKVSSASVNISIADSKAMSAAFFASAPSAIVSTADSKAVSVGTNVNPIPAGTRTVTTLSAYTANNAQFNVLDYAPVGFTINTGLNPTQAKAAIVAADLAASLTKGGYVLFPPGTYAWQDDLTPLPGAHWVGGRAAQYAVKLKAISASSRFLVTDDGKFTGFQFEGAVTTPGSYIGTAIQVGNTTFAGHVVFEDCYVTNFQTGLRLAAALWTTFSRCRFELCQVGIDWNAGSASLYSTVVSFYDCVARQNERNGIAATYVPITNQRVMWIGGSVETNCTTDTVTYPQVYFGSVGYFKFETYMEGGLYGGFYPVAINGSGMQEGEIIGYIHNSSRGIEDLSGTMTDVAIHSTRFAGTTTKCLNASSATRCVAYSNSYDAPNTFSGTGTALVTTPFAQLAQQGTTFTPTIVGTGGTSAHTYVWQYGYYSQIGNLIFFNGAVRLSAKDAGMTGTVSIGGLPAVSWNAVSVQYSTTPILTEGTTFSANTSGLYGQIQTGGQAMILYQQSTNGGSAVLLPVGNVSATSIFYFTGHYMVAPV